MRYSVEFKDTVVHRALTSNDTQEVIARSTGVGLSTLQKWLRTHRASGATLLSHQEKRPQDWTAEERYTALLETDPLSENEVGAWCRQHGLHSHHLRQWKIDALKGVAAVDGPTHNVDTRKLRAENQSLKKELRRKEKALAEASALLVLKKKAQLIWGDREDD